MNATKADNTADFTALFVNWEANHANRNARASRKPKRLIFIAHWVTAISDGH